MLPSRKPTIMPSLYLPLLLKKTKKNQTNKQRKQLTTTTKACQKNAGSKTNGSTNLSTSNRCAKDLLTKGCRLNASERLVCVLLFSHDVTTAILVSQNNEAAAMLVSQTSPVGVELFSYANAFFCSNKFA